MPTSMPPLSLPAAALAALAGVLLWSLAEYLLHRFLGHDHRTLPNPFAAEHTRHHAEGDYFAPTWKKALVALAAVPPTGAVAALVVDVPLGLVFALSFAATYLGYEWLHRRLHTHRGVGPWGRWLRRHHFHHHFVDPHTNHGVTSPVWDVAFGTRREPTRIRVPAKLRMRWLVDDATGEVRAELASWYELRRAG
ncbi:MAG: sterol desaturase family protein [Deltaproteobacteria bacterium]|nr:sterol desaturase family protein [Deltaproteobacteria bacterium]